MHLINMKRQCYLALGRNTELLFLDNCIDGTKCMKSKQFKRNECKYIFVKLNTFNTHMKRQFHLALGRHRIYLLGKEDSKYNKTRG